jgi:hypothetical protein
VSAVGRAAQGDDQPEHGHTEQDAGQRDDADDRVLVDRQGLSRHRMTFPASGFSCDTFSEILMILFKGRLSLDAGGFALRPMYP